MAQQLSLFPTRHLRDRTLRRNYSASAEEFRREHERHRSWGLTQRHARRLHQLRDQGNSAPAAISGLPSPVGDACPPGPPAETPRSKTDQGVSPTTAPTVTPGPTPMVTPGPAPLMTPGPAPLMTPGPAPLVTPGPAPARPDNVPAAGEGPGHDDPDQTVRDPLSEAKTADPTSTLGMPRPAARSRRARSPGRRGQHRPAPGSPHRRDRTTASHRRTPNPGTLKLPVRQNLGPTRPTYQSGHPETRASRPSTTTNRQQNQHRKQRIQKRGPPG
ncbi:hypothetical protein FB565_006803 [Actinoplanes lutulentus]|uniref:Uncharacterized protein n=1 Tax=Actinoplanes lutulentus TaxID=1287878 RepID=A0A327Z765_9ACTN|nr:hypothetical protein [Actinoplanes lutulentus]RAK30534.1 hypothetical protein B0I29_116193 [Actinoplanes lutulentus]